MIVGSQLSELSFFMHLRHIYKEYVLDIFWTTQTAALFLWMTTGDRSWFSRHVYTLFVESGLVHLLAVSGSNVVYVSLLLWTVLFWIPFYIRVLCIGWGLLMYGLFCGADSSVIRAISMGLLWLLATLSWRRIDIWRLLQIIAWGMLLRNPLILWYDLWFLLSFSAVVGIILISSWYRKICYWKKRRWYDVGMMWRLLPTRWATLAVLPVLILRTWKISLSSIWINLVVVPLVPVYLMFWWIMLLWVDFLRLHSLLAWMSAGLYSLAAWWTDSWTFLIAPPWGGRFLFIALYISFFCWLWHMGFTKKITPDVGDEVGVIL
jgi:competence protein ComEC